MSERVLPQSVAESELHDVWVRPQPSSHAADRLKRAQLPLDLVDPDPEPAAGAEVDKAALEAEARAIKWMPMLKLLQEAITIWRRKHDDDYSRKGSRWEEIAQFLARVLGLDLAECRSQPRQRGAVDIDLTMHKIMEVREMAGSVKIASTCQDSSVNLLEQALMSYHSVNPVPFQAVIWIPAGFLYLPNGHLPVVIGLICAAWQQPGPSSDICWPGLA